MKKIATCLWFDHQAEEAVKFYTSVFKNTKVHNSAFYGEAGAEVSGQKAGSLMLIEFELEDQEIQALNGGPIFQFSPSFSYYVNCTSEKEIDELWKKLSQGGQARMGLDKYPWAEKYGWTADKYGVEWQLILAPSARKISPAFLFTDHLFGKGEEAINFYMSLFPNSKIETMSHDPTTKTVMHSTFILNGQGFVLMEGAGKHGHSFTNANSLVVNCDTQEEIDRLWEKLAVGGTIEECGWLKDKYGVSWQVVPAVLAQLMSDPKKAEKVMQAMLKMKKLDIAKLKAAAQ